MKKEKRGESEMAVKLMLLVVFFAVMVAVGVYARRHTSSVDGFVLGDVRRDLGLPLLHMVLLIFLQLYS